MITKIEYTMGLNFDEVVEYIPLLTIDSEVITDGRITQFDISIDYERVNLFYDEITGHFYFQNCSDAISKEIYLIGNYIQSHYNSNDLETLVLDIQEVF